MKRGWNERRNHLTDEAPDVGPLALVTAEGAVINGHASHGDTITKGLKLHCRHLSRTCSCANSCAGHGRRGGDTAGWRYVSRSHNQMNHAAVSDSSTCKGALSVTQHLQEGKYVQVIKV